MNSPHPTNTLTLQRASAGSGKTYTLTYEYIMYLLTEHDGHGGVSLRPPSALRRKASSIMAVTFTNKATNEMKSRILTRLYDLANHDPSDASAPAPDYLNELTELVRRGGEDVVGVRRAIVASARAALRTLLRHYSEFRVSTIDSFFQTVLRTFAYEAGLNEGFELEIDDSDVTAMAVDSALTEIDSRPKEVSRQIGILRNLMKWQAEENNGWNIFSKQVSKTKTVYGDVLTNLATLEKEDFQAHREELHKFYAEHPDFDRRLGEIHEGEMAKLPPFHRKAVDAAVALRSELKNHPPASLNNNILNNIEKVINASPFTHLTISTNFKDSNIFKAPYIKTSGGLTAKGLELGSAFYDSLAEWVRHAGAFKNWRKYVDTLKYLSLLLYFDDKANVMMGERDIFRLSRTNYVLAKIIGEADAPFIYERIGSRIDNFLIDEFQDTSEMQWRNLRPLLSESLSRGECDSRQGNSSLIIGDAKQSIYRFRNADPSLITEKVPNDADLSRHIKVKGETPAENTNYRSHRKIVEFNNSLFSHIAAELDRKRGDSHFTTLYSNVRQNCKKAEKEDRGYVAVYPADADASTVIPSVIRDMLRRGYRQSDIAILVRSNPKAKEIIGDIMTSNTAPDSGEEREEIRVMSDESLMISNSSAVQTVVSALSLMADARLDSESMQDPDAKHHRRREKMTVAALLLRYRLFLKDRETAGSGEAIKKFLTDSEALSRDLEEVLSIKAATLPRLVQEIITALLDDEERATEAAFLAAFEDAVLEFCEGYDSDVAAFLAWWEKKGSKLSIAARPEDAVRILTIHKAKGLQYKCVIVVPASYVPKSPKSEWMWVRPDRSNVPEVEPPLPLPSYIPIRVADTTAGGLHGSEREAYDLAAATDELNTLYVACTRGAEEMHLFSPKEGVYKSAANLRAVEGADTYMLRRPLERGEGHVLTYGTPATVDSHRDEGQAAHNPLEPANYLESFGQGESQKYFTRTDNRNILTEKDPPERDALASVLDCSRTLPEVERNLKRKRIAGMISRGEEREALERLERMIEEWPEIGEWFDPENGIECCRPVLPEGHARLRPDRLVIYPDGRATLIDYSHQTMKDHAATLTDYTHTDASDSKCAAHLHRLAANALPGYPSITRGLRLVAWRL